MTATSLSSSLRVSRLHALAVAALVVLGLVAGLPAATPAHAATTTIVSLTFDDGDAEQATLPSLLPSGMPVTLFVNSGRVGMSGYLTWQQLTDLQSGGYEVGGHTVSHADLPTMSTDEQKRQVCDDRSALLAHGLNASDFAYPYGDDNATTQQIVHDCGYNSARTVGGLVSPTSCGACPYADSVPPANAYEVATPDSVKSDTTLTQLENLVTGVETNGGGWLPLVLHHLCSGSSCPVYSVDPSVLQQFATWLAGQSSNGTTVETVAQVIGGSLQPAVAGPPPPPAPAGSNLLQNPSLETVSSGSFPDCWQQGSTNVSNTASYSHTSDAHTGSFAESISISAYTSGDRKLVSTQDLGQCAPAVTPGHSYVVSGWYKTDTATARLIAFYLDTNNQWHYLTESKVLAGATSWAQGSFTVTAPSNAKAMSAGMLIASVGSLTMDDLSLVDPDHPTVTLTSPTDGSTVKGLTSVTSNASAPSGISKVELLVDGIVVDSTTTAPYSFAWDSTKHADGSAALAVRATDANGTTATSTSITVTVANQAPSTSSGGGTTGGSGGTGSSTPDTQAPTVSSYALPIATTASSVRVAWVGSDAGTGVKSYDVRYRRAGYNTGFGSWTYPSAWQNATVGAVSLHLVRGFAYCTQVRAHDIAGNVSGWTGARCVASPLDDRALAATKAWTRGKGKGFYAGTFTVTKAYGATLTRTGARLDRVGIVATKCRTCGIIAIYVGKKLIGKINLRSASLHKAQLILLPRFAYRTGTITIKVLSKSKTVQIDGLVACRT